MSVPKSSPPSFTFSTSSSPGNGNFKFSLGEKTHHRRRVCPSSKRSAPASGHNTTAPSSSFSFKFPPVLDDDLRPAAVTGTIPCQFVGSTYSSKPFESSCNTTEEAVKKEREENSVQKPSTSQIIVHRLMKGIPQSPHYWPLRGYSEAAKKSLINAWDHIFEEAVDQIQSLQLNGFCTDAKRLWDTTQELQMMGYNVVPLRRRLVELTDVVQRRMNHRTERMRLKGRAEQHMTEKNKLEFEIVKLKAKVEAEKASFEDVMAKVAKMDDEMPSFNDCFSKLAIKSF